MRGGSKAVWNFSENFGTCHLLEETLCHERAFFTKQLSRVVQKLLLCHLRKPPKKEHLQKSKKWFYQAFRAHFLEDLMLLLNFRRGEGGFLLEGDNLLVLYLPNHLLQVLLSLLSRHRGALKISVKKGSQR